MRGNRYAPSPGSPGASAAAPILFYSLAVAICATYAGNECLVSGAHTAAHSLRKLNEFKFNRIEPEERCVNILFNEEAYHCLVIYVRKPLLHEGDVFLPVNKKMIKDGSTERKTELSAIAATREKSAAELKAVKEKVVAEVALRVAAKRMSAEVPADLLVSNDVSTQTKSQSFKRDTSDDYREYHRYC